MELFDETKLPAPEPPEQMDLVLAQKAREVKAGAFQPETIKRVSSEVQQSGVGPVTRACSGLKHSLGAQGLQKHLCEENRSDRRVALLIHPPPAGPAPGLPAAPCGGPGRGHQGQGSC